MTDILNELKSIPDSLEDINYNPILKPLLEFKKVVSLLTRDEKSEKEYLEKKMTRLKDLLDKDIFDESPIAQRYADVFDVYQRIFLILVKYTEIADETVLNMKKTVEKYYMLKKRTIEIEKPIKKLGRPPKKEKIEEEINGFFDSPKDTPEDKTEGEHPEEGWKLKSSGKEDGRQKWFDHIRKVRKKNPKLKMPEVVKLASSTYGKERDE